MPLPAPNITGLRFGAAFVLAAGLEVALVIVGPGFAQADAKEWLAPTVQTGAVLATPGSRGGAPTGDKLRIRTRSIYEMKWENVVRQTGEVGCAAASLATLFTHFLDLPTDEDTFLQALVRDAESDPTSRDYRAYGFSLKHIRNVAARSGLVGRAFKVAPDDLYKLKIPVITRVTIKGYNHFVVLRGAQDGRIFVADPAFGNSSYRLKSFERIWSGVVMAFVHRSMGIPDVHDLLVQPGDERFVQTYDALRLALNGAPFAGREFRSIAVPLVPIPPVDGLESVLPVYLATGVEF